MSNGINRREFIWGSIAGFGAWSHLAPSLRAQLEGREEARYISKPITTNEPIDLGEIETVRILHRGETIWLNKFPQQLVGSHVKSTLGASILRLITSALINYQIGRDEKKPTKIIKWSRELLSIKDMFASLSLNCDLRDKIKLTNFLKFLSDNPNEYKISKQGNELTITLAEEASSVVPPNSTRLEAYDILFSAAVLGWVEGMEQAGKQDRGNQ